MEALKDKNTGTLTGILISKTMFSNKVGSFKMKVTTVNKDKEYVDYFYVTFFENQFNKLKEIEDGSLVTASYRLKNSSYEKDGVKVYKLGLNLTSIELLAKPLHGVSAARDAVKTQAVLNDIPF